MPVGDDTYAYRGRLPHLAKPDRTYFVTFCTQAREILMQEARDVVLQSCTYDHGALCWIDCVVVMPDHVHLIVTPYDSSTVQCVLRRIKSASAYRVNRSTGRTGPLWQRESFDRMVRSEENLQKKREYIFNNPVRAGLVSRCDEYKWCWSPSSCGEAGS